MAPGSVDGPVLRRMRGGRGIRSACISQCLDLYQIWLQTRVLKTVSAHWSLRRNGWAAARSLTDFLWFLSLKWKNKLPPMCLLLTLTHMLSLNYNFVSYFSFSFCQSLPPSLQVLLFGHFLCPGGQGRGRSDPLAMGTLKQTVEAGMGSQAEVRTLRSGPWAQLFTYQGGNWCPEKTSRRGRKGCWKEGRRTGKWASHSSWNHLSKLLPHPALCLALGAQALQW